MSSKIATLPTEATAERRLLNRAAGRYLRQLRGVLEQSQLMFSIELGVSVDSVQNYEAGDTTVPAWVLLAAESRVRAAGLSLPRTGAVIRTEHAGMPGTPRRRLLVSDEGGKTPGLVRLDQHSPNDGGDASGEVARTDVSSRRVETAGETAPKRAA